MTSSFLMNSIYSSAMGTYSILTFWYYVVLSLVAVVHLFITATVKRNSETPIHRAQISCVMVVTQFSFILHMASYLTRSISEVQCFAFAFFLICSDFVILVILLRFLCYYLHELGYVDKWIFCCCSFVCLIMVWYMIWRLYYSNLIL